MATDAAAMAVVRAARPALRGAHDGVAFAAHATFLAAGYSLCAVGPSALADPSPSGDEEEVGIDGWNSMENCYAFLYSKEEKSKKKRVLVKCLVIGEVLAVDVLDLEAQDKGPYNIQINVKDFFVEEQPKNYGDMYKNFANLIQTVNSNVLYKLDGGDASAVAATAAKISDAERSSSMQSSEDPDPRTADPSGPHLNLLDSENPARKNPGILSKRSNVGEGSQGQFHGPNTGAYQAAWNSYMYAYQPPPGFQPRGPIVAMNIPIGYAPAGFQQAGTTEAYVHQSEAALEGVVPPTGKTRPKKSVTRIKLRNFNPDEDKIIVKSWLEISCDPITGTGQKRDRMWQRIMERYNSRRGSNPVRSLRSIQSRWDTIKAEVTLFASYYADSIRENPSEMSDADKTTHAVGKFTAVQQRKFVYLHCWELMKDAPKWQDVSARDIAATARGEGFGEQTTALTHTMEPAEGQSSPVRSGPQPRRPMGRDSAKAAKKKANTDAGSSSSAEHAVRMQDPSPVRSGAQPRRPMGRDSAKAAKKKANTDAGSSSSAEHAARMQDLSLQRNTIMQDPFEEMRRNNEALIQIEQLKLQFMREQHEDEKRRHKEEKLKEEKKEDERILSIDLDACQPALRTYYQIWQQEILERQAARRQRSEGL